MCTCGLPHACKHITGVSLSSLIIPRPSHLQFLLLAVCKNGGRRPGESYHVICGTADVTDSRLNSLLTLLSMATEKLEN